MHRKRNVALIAVIIALIAVIIIALLYILINTLINNNSNNEYNNLASSYAPVATDAPSETGTAPDIETDKAENPIDFDSLSKQNSDIYSWIYIPDTNVNYPVCQSATSDNFYLNHDIYKNYSYAGAIYSQYCNSLDYSDRVTVLYGHNMANGTMFATLHRFEDSSFFDSHKYMYVYTKDRKLTYEIVSAFVYDDRHIMNSFDFSDDEVFLDYLDMIMDPHSITENVRDGVELDLNDKVLVLSTCLNSGEGRYLVQGVLVKDEQTK